MVCKQCGTNNDMHSSYCKLCGAPLQEAVQQPAEAQAPSQPQEGQPSSWGFVQPPSWPKPEFDINKVDDMQAPPPVFTPPSPPAGAQYTPAQPEEQAYRAPFAPQAPAQGYDTYDDDQGDAYQDEDEQPTPYRPKTVASVGDYENTGAYNTASFGRIPRRADYDEPEDMYTTASRSKGRTPAPRSSSRGSSSLNRRGSSRGRSRIGGSSYRGGGNRNTIIFIGAAAVLVVLILVFAGIILTKNFGSIGGFFSTVFGGSPILKPVETGEGIDASGNEVWEVTVHARGGNTITMRLGDKETSGIIESTNQIVLQIRKDILVPTTPWDGPTAELAPEVYITDKKTEEQIPVEIPPFTVNVPSLNLNVTTPQGSSVAVSRSKVTFSGTVDDASVEVSVQGQALTVNPDGTFTGEYDVQSVGSHSLTVEAKKPGYQIARATFQVDYSQSQAYIDVDRSSIRASDNTDTTNVKGKVDPGATISASCADSKVTVGTPSVDAEGNFSFSVTMSEIGAYTIDVNVTTSDSRNTAGVIIVERPPVLQTYSAAAYKMNYSRMMDEPTHTGSYKCIGTVTEILQDEPFHIARLQTSDGDILFEYHNNAAKVEVGDGKTYNVFGDYIGKDEETGLPLVYGWFIIKE